MARHTLKTLWCTCIKRWKTPRYYLRFFRWDEKNGVICPVSMFPSWVMFLKLFKKCIFSNVMLTSASNVSLLEQFTYIHLKDLVTHFQKMLLFTMPWPTASDILGFEIKAFCKISAESASFLCFNGSYLMNGGSDPYKSYNFLKEYNKKSQM